MHRCHFARVYELRDLLPDPVPPGAYFADFEKTLTSWPEKRARFLEIEADLQGLDESAWTFLKGELAPLLRAKQATRGWQPFFNKLNQAKGYNHLKRLGCSNIRFVPESNTKDRLTPDIEAVENGRAVLCEVKTINISEAETKRRLSGGVWTSTDHLNEQFVDKLRSTIDRGVLQMQSHNAEPGTRRIVYVVINFDDMLHEYADQYASQMAAIIAHYPVSGLEIFLHHKGPFGG